MKAKISWFVLVNIVLITISLWISGKDDTRMIFEQPLRASSQIFALLGLVLMSITLLLSTRNKFVEYFFGGLDKTYYIHRYLGSVSFLFLINHPLLLAAQYAPNIKMSLQYLLPGADFAYNLGILALYTMILSFIFMVFIKLPYNIWKFIHQFLGVSFLLGGVHSLLVASDVNSNPLLTIWIGIFLLIGIVSFFYIVFLYKHIGPKFLYEIVHIERSLDIVNIYLKPLTKRVLNFYPGQFAYMEFKNKTIGSEMHPFSISSAPQDDYLRISVKMLGDYTVKIPQLRVSDRVFLYGPYGAFGGKIKSITAPVVWIGGGIGATPFVSMARSRINTATMQPVYFYYCYGTEEEGVFNEELQIISKNDSTFKYVNWPTQKNKRLTAEKIAKDISLKEVVHILLCGPMGMMEGLKKQFISLGVPETKIMFENFSLLE